MMSIKLSDIMSSFWGKLWFVKFGLKIKKSLQGDKKSKGKTKVAGFEIGEGLMQMMGGFTVLRLTSMMGAMNINFTKKNC